MLKLKNIKINGDHIEADYIPEDSKKKAHVKIGIKDGSEEGEIIEEYGGSYRRHAYYALQQIMKRIDNGEIKEPPSEKLVMWY